MKNEHQDVKGIAYVRDRGYMRCPECGLYVPLKGRSTATCTKCKLMLAVWDGEIKIVEVNR